MSNRLPTISVTRVEIPRAIPMKTPRRVKTVSKTATQSITARMPRGAKPASLTPSMEFLSIPIQIRNRLEIKVDDLFRGVSFSTIEYETIPNLITIIKERKRHAVLDANYEASQKCENMIRYISSMSLQRKFNTIKNATVQDLRDQLRTAQSQLIQMERKWKQKVQDFNDQQSESTKRLERNHQMKLQEFDSQVPKELPPEYCKLSADLLNLREQERQLVFSKRYDEAIALRKEGDKREKQETQAQKQRFVRETQQRRQKLLQDQRNAIECFTMRWTKQSENLNKEMNKELNTQRKIIENIQLKINEAESENLVTLDQ